MARVVGAEHIEEVRAKGLRHFEILPGDIVTDLAVETAARVGIKLVEGPLERPAPVRTVPGGTSVSPSTNRRGTSMAS